MSSQEAKPCGGSGWLVLLRPGVPCPGCPDCRPCTECHGEGCVEAEGSYGATSHPTCLRCHGTGVETAHPRLIVLEEEEVERAEYLAGLAHARNTEVGDLTAALLRSLVARYEDGITEDEADQCAHALDVGFHTTSGPHDPPCPTCVLRDKLRAAFTPPTQRSDSE